MFIREALQTLDKYTVDMATACKNVIGYNSLNARLRAHSSPIQARVLGPAILATLLTFPKMKFRIINTTINRTVLSIANLSPRLGHLTPPTNELDERRQLKDISAVITNYYTEHATSETESCALYIIKTTSGFSNLKRFLEKANYETTAIDTLKTYDEHKVDVYKILNAVFIITNDSESINYAALTGWLPILFKEQYAELKTNETLYNFYKKAYNEKTTDYKMLKQLPCFTNLHQTMRTNRINTMLNNLEQSLKNNLDRQVTDAKAAVATLERDIRNAYTALDTALRLKSTGASLADKDLITMCLNNNPNVIDVGPSNTTRNAYYLLTYGPVDYDRTAMQSILKSKSNFVKWLFTTTEYTLCWESLCTIDIARNEIRVNQDQHSSRGHIRNTHWHRYQCLGNNRTPIAKALIHKDYLSAFSQIITAAQLLNAYDITVLNALIEDLVYTRPNSKAFMNNETKEMYTTAEMEHIFKQAQKVEVNENAK